jgi:WG containing repeat
MVAGILSVLLALGFSTSIAEPSGLWVVTLNGKQGFINKSGHLVIPAQFKIAWGFSEGLAPVWAEDGRAGYIDTSGKVVIPAQFDSVRGFRQGMAEVELGGRWSFIDKTGRFVVPPTFGQTQGFSEDYAAFEIQGKWGFLDARWMVAIAPDYDRVGNFSEGLAGAFKDGKCGFIDKAGKVVVPFGFIDCGTFSGGMAPVKTEPGGHYGYIDKAGRWLIPPTHFDSAMPFDKGFAAVAQDGKWGLIDVTGLFVLQPQFDYDPFAGFRSCLFRRSFVRETGRGVRVHRAFRRVRHQAEIRQVRQLQGWSCMGMR